MILKINNSRENDRIFPIQIHLKQPVMHSSLLKRENSFRIIEQNNSRLPLTTPSPPLPSPLPHWHPPSAETFSRNVTGKRNRTFRPNHSFDGTKISIPCFHVEHVRASNPVSHSSPKSWLDVLNESNRRKEEERERERDFFLKTINPTTNHEDESAGGQR